MLSAAKGAEAAQSFSKDGSNHPLLPYSPTPLLPYSPTPLLPYSSTTALNRITP